MALIACAAVLCGLAAVWWRIGQVLEALKVDRGQASPIVADPVYKEKDRGSLLTPTQIIDAELAAERLKSAAKPQRVQAPRT